MLNSLENKHRKPRSPVTYHTGLSWCPHCMAWEAECEKHSYGLKALGSSLEKVTSCLSPSPPQGCGLFFFLAVHLLPGPHFILAMSPDKQEHPEMHVLLVPGVPSLLIPQAECSLSFDLSTFMVEPFDPYTSDSILLYPERSTGGTPAS